MAHRRTHLDNNSDRYKGFRIQMDLTNIREKVESGFRYPFRVMSEQKQYNPENIMRLTPTQREPHDVENFPHNIDKYYWVSVGNEETEDAWILLCKLRNGLYVLYIAECTDGSGFHSYNDMRLYASNHYINLIYYAMSNQEYKSYIAGTVAYGVNRTLDLKARDEAYFPTNPRANFVFVPQPTSLAVVPTVVDQTDMPDVIGINTVGHTITIPYIRGGAVAYLSRDTHVPSYHDGDDDEDEDEDD